MAKRKRIRDNSEPLDISGIAYDKMPLRAYIANLKYILDDFAGPQYDDAIIKVVNHCEDADTIYVISFRDETDKEMERRLFRRKNASFRAKQAREKVKADKTMEERRELQRLLAKYKPSVLLEDKD